MKKDDLLKIGRIANCIAKWERFADISGFCMTGAIGISKGCWYCHIGNEAPDIGYEPYILDIFENDCKTVSELYDKVMPQFLKLFKERHGR